MFTENPTGGTEARTLRVATALAERIGAGPSVARGIVCCAWAGATAAIAVVKITALHKEIMPPI